MAMKKLSLYLLILLFGGIVFLVSCSSPKTLINMRADGVALKGYDPVAYFTLSRAVPGQEKLRYTWRNARWYFSSREHLELFKDDPDKYMPQYGGYCAYAVSRGTTADIDPEAWAIVDNKLYLNLNKEVQKMWQQDREGYIKKADENWPRIKRTLR
jgi:YHS domain-containing protein